MPFRASRFVFLVPLKARASSVDWPEVVNKFRATLSSFQNQSDPGWRMIVACQDNPFEGGGDPRAEWLRVDMPPPQPGDAEAGVADRAGKVMRMGMYLREHGADDVYAMAVDADDLMHRDVVKHALASDNRRGHLAYTGYRYDCTTARLTVIEPPLRPMFQLCGSTAAVYLTCDDLPVTAVRSESYFGKLLRHPSVERVAGTRGRTLEQFPFPAVVYRINHVDSQQFFKRGMKRHAGTFLEDADASEILARDFGWNGHACTVDAPAMNVIDLARTAMSREERQERRRLRRDRAAAG